jgi:hypothetical protein
MIQNLMNDMWKNVGDMKGMNLMEDMNSTKIGLQMLDFQKNAFSKMYNSMLQIQQQTEKMAEPLLKNNPFVPEGLNMLKENQKQFKKAIDDGFVKAESFFFDAGSPVKKAKPQKK